MTTKAESLAVLMRTAPAVLRERLTTTTNQYGHSLWRSPTLAEAEVAAQDWMQEKGWVYGWEGFNYYVADANLPYVYSVRENACRGANVFEAINSAVGVYRNY